MICFTFREALTMITCETPPPLSLLEVTSRLNSEGWASSSSPSKITLMHSFACLSSNLTLAVRTIEVLSSECVAAMNLNGTSSRSNHLWYNQTPYSFGWMKIEFLMSSSSSLIVWMGILNGRRWLVLSELSNCFFTRLFARKCSAEKLEKFFSYFTRV